MNAKSHNPLHKFLSGLALAGLILSLCLGSRGASAARAQAAWTDTPSGSGAATELPTETVTATPPPTATVVPTDLPTATPPPTETVAPTEPAETSVPTLAPVQSLTAIPAPLAIPNHPFNLGGGKNPVGNKAGVNPASIALGAPGLSFRFLQTFGVTEEAYPADVQHINSPTAVFVDGSDNLFVVEDRGARVLKYRTSDRANLLSIGKAGMENRDSYTFDWPNDVVTDGDGNIWVVDNHRIAKYDASGTFLLEFPSADPWATGSDDDHFNGPRGLAFNSAGQLFVADGNNERIQIFDIVSGTPVYNSTIGHVGDAGSGDGYFNYPSHLAFDSSDRLYVADSNNYRVERCTFASSVWTCANFFGEPTVSGTDLTHLGGWFNGLTIQNDNLFIADAMNHRVLKCNLAGSCSLFAGVTGVGGTNNTHFLYPSDVALDSSGNVYVGEYGNHRVQELNGSAGYVKTFGVTQVPYLPDTVRYNTPRGLTVASDGSIYFTEGYGYRLVKLNAAGTQQWTAGQAGVSGSDNAHFAGQWDGLVGNPAVDSSGRVYVPDTGNDRIQIFDASTGNFTTTWGSSGSGPSQFSCPWGVAISPVNGWFFVVDRCNNRIQVFNSSRVYQTQLGNGTYGSTNTEFAGVSGVAIDKNGVIYVADSDNNRVQKCTLTGTSYICSLFVGVNGEWGNDFAHLAGPYSVAVDGSSRVFVSDTGNNRVQVFDSTGAYLTTIGGSYGSNTGQLRNPKGLALDSQGNVYVTDSTNSRIQKFAPGVPGWLQANLNGFGDISDEMVKSLEVYNNQIYAGTGNNSGEGGQVWRTSNGSDWTAVSDHGFGIASPGTNALIYDMIEFKGQLYAGAGNWSNDGVGGQIWRCTVCDGSDWEMVEGDGFGSADNSAIASFSVFNNILYASTFNFGGNGVEIWHSGSGNNGDWTRVVTGGNGDASNYDALLTPLNGFIYAAVENNSDGMEIWQTADGATWNRIYIGGFGDPANNQNSGGLVVFDGELYVGTGSGNGIARVYRYHNGIWGQVGSDGFGDSNNNGISGSLTIYNDALYAAVTNHMTGMEVWSTTDGTDWVQVSLDGFGDSNNVQTIWNCGTTVFNNNLYLGTWNQANGGEIWRKLHQVFLPLVMR